MIKLRRPLGVGLSKEEIIVHLKSVNNRDKNCTKDSMNLRKRRNNYLQRLSRISNKPRKNKQYSYNV